MRPVLVTLAVLACPPSGRAELRPRALIMASTSPAAKRLHGELRALGWQTVRIPAEGQAVDLIGLHARMTNARATAAIAMLGSGEAVEVWVMDDVGMVVSREQFRGIDARPELVAVRTVESLRAYRLSVATRKAPGSQRKVVAQVSKKPKPQQSDLEAPIESAPAYGDTGILGAVELNGGLAVGWAPGGLSPTGQLRLGGSWLPFHWLAADLIVLLPIVPASADAEKGESDVHLALAGVALRWLGGTNESWMRPSIGAGIGALVARLRGYSKDAQFDADRDWLACAMPFVEGGITFRITPHLRVVSSLMVGVGLPRIVIAYLGPDTSIGKPMLTGTVGVQLELP